MQGKTPPPERTPFFALWDRHNYLICVYQQEARANLCAALLGCSVRPIDVSLLEAYARQRLQTLTSDQNPDPPVSLYLSHRAPIWVLSRLITYLATHATPVPLPESHP